MSLKAISPETFRAYVQSHHENDYVLVDVRQPEEYRQAHIPGAKLMPLPQLVQTMEQLPSDKELVFYCHSGGRSMAAAAMLDDEGHAQTIYNLTGGMLAWDGARLADFPHVELFEGQTVEEMFRTAINLEKGAQRFYEAVSQAHEGEMWARTFDRLAKAEIAHAKIIYGFLKQIDTALDPFDSVYERCNGEVLEGGMTLERALAMLSRVQGDACLRLVETALQIEYAAFDLYRTLAHEQAYQGNREDFLKLAQAEKAHMQALIDVINGCE